MVAAQRIMSALGFDVSESRFIPDTVHHSVGIGSQDVVVARILIGRAREREVGTEVDTPTMSHTDVDDTDLAHLRRTIELADETGDAGNRPFGAVAVGSDGHVISEGANSVATSGDVTEHAELDAITTACAEGRTEQLVGATMYASGEPCPMCSAAMVLAGIRRVVFAASSDDFGRILPDGPRFGLRCSDVVESTDVEIEVSGPHLGDEALAPFHRFLATD